MSYSCSDFTQDVLNNLINNGELDDAAFDDDDTEQQAQCALDRITTLRNQARAGLALYNAIAALLNAGNYNDEGEWTLPPGQWDGQGDPPDTSDHPAMLIINEAIRAWEGLDIATPEHHERADATAANSERSEPNNT